MDEEDHRRAEEEMKDLYLTHMQKRKDSERFMRRLCGLVYKAAFVAMGVATMVYILPLNKTLRRASSSFFEGDKQDQGALTAVSALLLALALSFAVLARPRPASEYEAIASTEFFHYSVTFPAKQEDDDSEAVILSEVEESEVDGSVPPEVISKCATVDSPECHITNQCAVSAAATTDDDDDSCGETRLGSEEDSISSGHDTSFNANTSKQGAPETRVSDVSGEEVGNVLNEWVGHRSELITVASVEPPPQSVPCVEMNGSGPNALALPCNAFQTRSHSLKRKRKIVHHSGPAPAPAPAPVHHSGPGPAPAPATPAMKAGIGLRARLESKNQCQSDVGKRGDIAAKYAPSIYSLINQQKRKAAHKEIKEQVDKVRHHRCEEDRYKENAKTNAFDKMHKSKKMSRSVAVAPSNHHLHQWLSSTNSNKSKSKNKEVRHTHNNYEGWKKKPHSSNTMPFSISEEVYFQKKKVHSSNTIPCNVNPILEEAYIENPPIIREEDKTEDGGSLKGTANSSNDIAINNVSTESKTDDSSSVSSLFAIAPPPPPPPFPLSRRQWFSRVVTNSCSESTSQAQDQPSVYMPPHCTSASPSVEEINRSTDAFIAKDHPSVHIPPHCPSPSPSIEEINRSADAFIAEFYRQLKLQKLDSVNKKASVSR